MKHFYFLLFAVFFSLPILYAQQAPFITTWEVTAGSLDITIPTQGIGYDYTVDFGDGTVQNNVTGDVTHSYSTPGIYTVSITGDFPRIYFSASSHDNRKKILSVEQWGDIQWQSMLEAFHLCVNLVINAIDAPDLSQVTDLSGMLSWCYMFNQSINHWDVSNVTNMSGMFENATVFNQPLNAWDVSNVTNMSSMFGGVHAFNQPIGNWNVSNVNDMQNMFISSLSFNQPLNNWDVSNVTNMEGMFRAATSFDQSLSNWNVSNVTNMYRMFMQAENFNQPLNSWDVSNVTNMHSMFHRASLFNQPLDFWDTSNVTNMDLMFYMAQSFNQNLNNWNVSNVMYMRQMFYSAQSFNQPLNNWDVSSVTNMGSMFELASSFNQDINNWNVSNVTYMAKMFRDTQAFNQPLSNWDVSNVGVMDMMFYNAQSFNQPLNNWDLTNALILSDMFRNATSFNQPLNNWNVVNVFSMGRMFQNAQSFNQDLSNWQFKQSLSSTGGLDFFLSFSGMDRHNYDKLLTHLATLNINNIELGADNLKYCNYGARDYLINQRGWTISGDVLYANCNKIIGDILYDQNNNGCDPNDPVADGLMIVANDGIYDWITYSVNGIYNLGVYGTNFTVSVVNHPSYFTVTPASVPVIFTTSPTEIVDFCVTANQSIEDLNITLLPPSEARPGFDADYRLVMRNVGTQTINNVDATLQFDDLMQQFVSSNPAPGTTTANTLTFSIGTMQPFQTVEMDIEMLTFQPPTVNGGDILNFTANVSPSTNDFTPVDNTFNLAQVVVNSFDPNDKQVLQGEELHIDHKDEYLDYMIRFQNTGTASAINVRILDTLHPKLDWNTLIPISASHDYYVKITEGNQVEFMFDNIHLPDSISNEPASHGYVAYKIKPKSSVQIGDVISGDAAIYFDFNAPIITNMVHTVVVETVGINDNSRPENQVVLYPNPAQDLLYVHRAEGVQLEEIRIYDLQGRVVQKLSGEEDTIQVAHLSAGTYLVEIKSNNGTFTKRIVRE